jgi:hypothetical protein
LRATTTLKLSQPMSSCHAISELFSTPKADYLTATS